MTTLALIVSWGAVLIGARLATTTHSGRDPFAGVSPLYLSGRIRRALGGRI